MLEGYIKRIFFDKKNDMSEDDEDEVRISHYVILEIIDNNNNDYNIKGSTSIKPEIGDLIEMTDYIKKYNQRYNRYDYETDTIIAIKLPTDKSEIIDRLINLKILKYGKNRIKLLVDKHYLDLWNIDKLQKLIESDVNNKIFYEKVIDYINDKNNNFNKKINLLLDYFMHNYNISFTTKEISKIEKHLKNIPESVEDIDIENLLLKLCGYISDKKIGEIIEKINFDELKKNKIKIMIEIRKQEDNGNSCIKKDYLIKRININNINIALEKLEEETYIVEYNDFIYSNEQYNYEKNIAERLYTLYNNSINSSNIYEFGKYEEKINELDKQQLNSIFNMFNCKISIITGGPGYGKSSIIKTFLKMCDITKEHCTILGPTGKVVSKLRDDINEETNDCKIMTLHKFLRIYESYIKNEEKKEKMGDNYKDNDISQHIEEFYNDTQETDYIIIDEMSMISNKLFSEFLDNLSIRNMTPNIILIGDIDQLAAIECGDVLKNLIHSRCIPTTFLLTPYRYQKFKNLKNAIDDINDCKRPKDGQYYKFIKTNNKKDFDNKFNTLLCEMITKYKDHELGKQNALDNIMIITPMRNTIKEYQEYIRSKHQEYKNNNLYDEMQNKIKDGINKRDEYLINDYIIIKKNIYVHNQNKKEYLLTDNTDETIYINDLVVHKIKPSNKDNKPFDLFNGMVGYITRIVEEENKIKYYNINLGGCDDKFVKIEKNFLNEKIINDYAYINTVHKYQGSENNLSIVVLPEKYSPFLSKQLLYTAVSRAKKECIVIGEEEVYEKMIKNSSIRYSNLKDIIIEEFKSNNNFNEINHEEVYDYAIKNNNLKKKSYGIPTMYNKILYRSRIEAKWAYIFDKLNLKHHYEYIDMNYYIPDFFITAECNTIKNLMVEVKNELYDEEKYDKYYQKAIDAGCCGTLLIINGCFEDIQNLDDKFKNCISIGKLYFRKKKRTKISEMILYKNEYDEFMLCYLYKNNIYNKINKKCIIDEDNPLQFINKMTEKDKLYIENEWKKITNEVQYKSSMKLQLI